MAISHAFSNTQANATGTLTVWNGGSTVSVAATDVVRPQDWNSAHNQFYTLSGNTSNASTASGTNVVLQGAGGVTLAGSTGTIVVSGAYNSAQFTNSTANATQPIVWAGNSNGSGNVTMGLTGSTVTMSAAGGGGAGIVMSDYSPIPEGNNTSFSSFGQNTLHFQPFTPPTAISMSAVQLSVSLSSATSSISHSVGETIQYGVYGRGSGASTSQFSSMASSSFIIQASFSSNLSGGMTVGNAATSFTSSSAGTVFGSVLSGQKEMLLPFSTSFAGGNDYLLGILCSTTSTGNTGALRASFLVKTNRTNASYGVLANTTVGITNASVTNNHNIVIQGTTTGAFPATIAQSNLSILSGNQVYFCMEM